MADALVLKREWNTKRSGQKNKSEYYAIFAMIFRDPELQQHIERVVSVIRGCPLDQLPICALLDAWHWFHLTKGDESPQTKEVIEHLLSVEMRPALRAWYHRYGDNMNPAALEFRERLSSLAGEGFG
jgi:hypothetical protein